MYCSGPLPLKAFIISSSARVPESWWERSDIVTSFVAECSTDVYFAQLWVRVLSAVHYIKKFLWWGLRAALNGTEALLERTLCTLSKVVIVGSSHLSISFQTVCFWRARLTVQGLHFPPCGMGLNSNQKVFGCPRDIHAIMHSLAYLAMSITTVVHRVYQ